MIFDPNMYTYYYIRRSKIEGTTCLKQNLQLRAHARRISVFGGTPPKTENDERERES
jgi:hypothetical protein